MIDRNVVLRAIRASRLASLEETLLELLEPSVRLGVMAINEQDLPIGASRFGGFPDVPDGFEWPIFDDRPMALVAQFDLSEIAPLDPRHLLPSEGWLYFFFDAANDSPFEENEDELRPWKVVYHAAKTHDLTRTEPPEGRSKHNEFDPFAIGFREELTLPSFGSTLLGDGPIDETRQEDYEKLVFSMHEKPPLPIDKQASRIERSLGRIRHWWIGDPIHRILGHPEHFQLDPRIDWQRLSEHRPVVTAPDEETQSAARDWLLLLQADTFRGGPEWLWGDNATLYFGIRKEDLVAGNFDQAQWTIECG